MNSSVSKITELKLCQSNRMDSNVECGTSPRRHSTNIPEDIKNVCKRSIKDETLGSDSEFDIEFNEQFKVFQDTNLISSSTMATVEGFVKIDVFGEKLDIHFEDTATPNVPALICLHGNSGSCKDFYKVFHLLGNKYRIIAFDLPGHGKSTSVINNDSKEKIYSFPGYASAMAKAIKALKIDNFFVLGVSLGGHNALSLLAMQNSENVDPEFKEISNKIKGAIITGTPPLDLSHTNQEAIMGKFMKGFKNDFMEQLPKDLKTEMQQMGIAHLGALLSHEKNLNDGSKESHRLAEFFVLVQGIELTDENQFMVEMVKNTCGEARKYMIGNMLKGGIDNQKSTVEETKTPLLIIAGQDDRGISLDYIKTLNLSPVGQLKILPGQHGIFVDNSFSEAVGEFLSTQI